jgi:hypothetical protein
LRYEVQSQWDSGKKFAPRASGLAPLLIPAGPV